jgi:osmotically-inducible protein OsmY
VFPYWPYPEGEWPRRDRAPAGPDPGDPLDEVLARMVADRFVLDPAMGSGHVVVAVQNRVVILEGRLRSAAAREAASRLAWETPGVFDVCNRLVVSAGSW